MFFCKIFKNTLFTEQLWTMASMLKTLTFYALYSGLPLCKKKTCYKKFRKILHLENLKINYSKLIKRSLLSLNRRKRLSINTAWKLPVFGVILVRIFPHSEWIRRDTEYLSETVLKLYLVGHVRPWTSIYSYLSFIV